MTCAAPKFIIIKLEDIKPKTTTKIELIGPSAEPTQFVSGIVLSSGSFTDEGGNVYDIPEGTRVWFPKTKTYKIPFNDQYEHLVSMLDVVAYEK